MIERYLETLAKELGRAFVPRRRILLESRAHLEDAARAARAAGRSRGEAEREAIERFGSAACVASRFAEQYGSASARRGAFLAGAATLTYLAAYGVFGSSAPAWARDFPHGAPTILAVQLAAVASIVAVLRIRDARGGVRVATRATGVAACAVLAGGIGELALAASSPAGLAAFASTTLSPWLVAVAALCAFAATGAACLAFLRMRGRPASIEPPTGLLHVVYRAPVRSCAGLAAVGFLFVAANEYMHLRSAAESAVLFQALTTGAVEATAIVVGFIAFGGVLGLRPRLLRT